MTKEIHDINARVVDFVVELIEYIFEYPDDDYMTMECLCRKLVKYGLIDKKDGYYLVADGIKADRKTEPSNSEKPNDCDYAENPSGDVWECSCYQTTICEHQKEDFNPDGTINIVECKTEPQTEEYEEPNYYDPALWE
jgi:hypothetical protein